MREIKNARIVSTMLGNEDHGILSAYLSLDYGGSGQSFGGFALDGVPAERSARSRRRPSPACGLFIAEVLRVLDVPSWEKLPGAFCRVEADFGGVYRIGHPLRDEWFDPREAMAALREDTADVR